jgi:hypothetical protein
MVELDMVAAEMSALYSKADPDKEPLLWDRFYETVSAEIHG